ncbi:hypothetical protein EDD15DRAFT_2194665 [Pisolithus albus]|nr:hypothetical protein EDD15DRAFT_2194660 [Pisolithus albus]KAI5996954.1 hypothetical protein EDD15DRAFT_2194665 [Pisolithus albus]
MVQTREKNKDTHPGQPVAPKPRRPKEQVAAERIAKATASHRKAEKRRGHVAGLASLEQSMLGESQQALAQVARPPASQVRKKIARTFSVHNLESLGDSQSLPVNQENTAVASTNHDVHKRSKILAPKPRLREEVESMAKQQGEGLSLMKTQGKRKAAALDFDKDCSNKRVKPYKPSGLTLHRRSSSGSGYPSREQTPNETISQTVHQLQTPGVRPVSFNFTTSQAPATKPPSHSHIRHTTGDSADMPVNDYGGFHEEDESVEHDFALQHQRTTSNSKTLLRVTCGTDHESGSKPALPRAFGKSNTTLPEEISPRFQDVFIPTLLAFCGTVPNPWNLPHPLQDIIADLWPVVFPQIPYDEQQHGPGTSVFLVARQRVYDWHSKFAKMGEKTIAGWFESDEFTDDESRAAWADWAIDENFGLPFVFKYLKSNNKGIGAFRAPLLLQTMAFHYTKMANALPCPQINVYPHGALTLATVTVERAISMWAETGHRSEESKRLAGAFSGSPQTKWGISSASYAFSIGKLSNAAWEEIKDGALEYAKNGRRFKTSSPDITEDARACIVDCNSDEESTGSISGDDDDPQEYTAHLQDGHWVDRACNNPDIRSPPSPVLPAAPQVSTTNRDTTNSQFAPLLPPFSPIPITDDPAAMANSGTSFHSIVLPFVDPFTTSSGLKFGDQFLSGPLTTVISDRDTKH